MLDLRNRIRPCRKDQEHDAQGDGEHNVPRKDLGGREIPWNHPHHKIRDRGASVRGEIDGRERPCSELLTGPGQQLYGASCERQTLRYPGNDAECHERGQTADGKREQHEDDADRDQDHASSLSSPDIEPLGEEAPDDVGQQEGGEDGRREEGVMMAEVLRHYRRAERLGETTQSPGSYEYRRGCGE